MAWKIVRGVAHDPAFSSQYFFSHGITTVSLGDQKTAEHRWLPAGARCLVLGEQVHKARVAWVTAKTPNHFIPETDGLLTSEAGIALGVFTADCVPVLLAWPEEKIVGAVHAGWRGLAAGIIGKTCKALTRRTQRKNFNGLRIAVGPRIGSCCYQVGDDVVQAFPDSVESRGRAGKFLDLAGEIVRQLKKAGVSPKTISVAPYCTMEDPHFFSHRRNQDGRRILASIVRR